MYVEQEDICVLQTFMDNKIFFLLLWNYCHALPQPQVKISWAEIALLS